MRIRKAFLAAAIGLGLLTGCVNFQVDEHSYQFNEATGSLSLRLLLLNAVRASKDYPLQFTKISGYQGQGTSSASLSASLPILSPGSGSLTPKVDVKDGISELNLVDLNTEEVQAALRKPLTLDAYSYLFVYRGSRSFVAPYMLMVEILEMSKELHQVTKDAVTDICDIYLRDGASQQDLPRFDHNRFACSELRKLESQCPALYTYMQPFPNTDKVVLLNEVTHECKYNRFVASHLQLFLIGLVLTPAPQSGSERDDPRTVKKAPGNTFNIFVSESKGAEEKGKVGREGVAFLVYDRLFIARCLRAKLCVRKPQGGKNFKGAKGLKGGKDRQVTVASDYLLEPESMRLIFRSPERMVRYLGELVSAQNYGPNRFVPRVYDPVRQGVFTLLTVKRGTPAPGGAAVSIVDPDGERFYVPRRDPEALKADLSMEMFSILSEVLNLAVSKKAFPPVTSLRVKGD